MENQETNGQDQKQAISSISDKLTAAKAVVTAKAGQVGAESGWIPEILNFLIDILPEIISIFHPSKDVPAASGAPGAAEVPNSATTPLAVEGGH